MEGYFPTHGIFIKCHLLGQRDVVFVYFQSKLLLSAGALGIPKNFQRFLPVLALGLKNRKEQNLLASHELKKVRFRVKTPFSPLKGKNE